MSHCPITRHQAAGGPVKHPANGFALVVRTRSDLGGLRDSRFCLACLPHRSPSLVEASLSGLMSEQQFQLFMHRLSRKLPLPGIAGAQPGHSATKAGLGRAC